MNQYEELNEMMPKQKSRSNMELNPLPIVLIGAHLLDLDEVKDECFK